MDKNTRKTLSQIDSKYRKFKLWHVLGPDPLISSIFQKETFNFTSFQQFKISVYLLCHFWYFFILSSLRFSPFFFSKFPDFVCMNLPWKLICMKTFRLKDERSRIKRITVSKILHEDITKEREERRQQRQYLPIQTVDTDLL